MRQDVMFILRRVCSRIGALPALVLPIVMHFGSISPASAACGPKVGNVITCTGNFPTGNHNAVAVSASTATLNVNSLTEDIAPEAGRPGVGLVGVLPAGPAGEDGELSDGEDGGSGATGPGLTINHTGGAYKIDASGYGIVAVSKGGDGGRGGHSDDIDANGGDGGDGGVGGSVTVNSSGEIATTGNFSHGILAESIGGNGGVGGDGDGIAATGGTGGDAAGGGRVTVDNSAKIATTGRSAHGIFGQSIGGRGGAGGDAGGIWAEAGGGGIAAPGGRVEITNSGEITTEDSGAYGIFAQSVGGFGGDGGDGGGVVAFGQDGASAGDGGTVRVTNTGTITTFDYDSHAILAQSVGGGGGAGGSSGGLVGFGGPGSPGGAGGTVDVSNEGPGHIITSGTNAKGIFAQSIGGGGGDGGVAGGLVAIGGEGSSTSSGGEVTVTNSQAITTEGDRSQAIFAQSVGGGGGNGGLSGGLIAIGGSGGGGGGSSTVRVSSSGALTTDGEDSVGIFAQSVGGGGGNGGRAFSGGLGGSLAIGGDAALGGAGGMVIVNETTDVNALDAGRIETHGTRAHGIQAQSVGGGGGNGGLGIAGALGDGFSLTVGLGGSGGGGGVAGSVTVNEKGIVATSGDQAIGILAQSVGGGGGNGGGAIAASGSGGVSIAAALGGTAGSGGAGGKVTVNAAGSIFTTGDLSHGVLAQSVGGGGGNGGFSGAAAVGQLAGTVSLGGKGGAGGGANTVTVNVSAGGNTNPLIRTLGQGSVGILAQSVGGGGGNGGFAGALSGGTLGTLSIGLGGGGGGGGAGGRVDVTNAVNIMTAGDNATGILAQSVGGGGGNGGFALAGSGGTVALSAAIGGQGAGGNDGGVIVVEHAGNIATTGDQAAGIIAQSVGGGGGNGGFAGSAAVGSFSGSLALGAGGDAGGDGKTVTVTTTATGFDDPIISTTGNGSTGIFAQSVGGGGGNGGFSGSIAAGTGANMSLGLGGAAGTGGRGGTVNVTNGLGIVTNGHYAAGIVAQSVGGGGGNGGFAVSAGAGGAISVAAAVGGAGGAGSDGGTVDVNNSGNIRTTGGFSYGLIAQSIGGGGGNAGFAISGAVGVPIPGLPGGAAAISVGGTGGEASNGGTVTVDNSGSIETHGYGAHAIVAQSVGGGGGNGGASVAAGVTLGNGAALGVAVGGSGGVGGDAGAVDVTSTGESIRTFGDYSVGVLAQSIGGGGGNGGFAAGVSAAGTLAASVSVGGSGEAGGDGSTVDVHQVGLISTSGEASHGISAQSIGGGGGNGGFSVAGGFTPGPVGLGFSIGGFGEGGGTGAAVDVEAYRTGAGPANQTTAALGTVTLMTRGDRSNGILAQSIGGGGGNGGFSAAGAFSPTGVGGAVSVGGSTLSGGGSAADVTVTSVHNIVTLGESSSGILAQSIGGGGGNGGFSVGFAAGSVFGGAASVGGFGATGGDAGNVTVNSYGSIFTEGDNSNGVAAQSIGGGGGNGGFSLAGGFSMGPAGLGLSVGGFGEGGGTAGDVTVHSYASTVEGVPVVGQPPADTFSIQTAGDNSNGILAQSLGGGGGNGGFSGAIGGSLGGAGIAASVGGFGGGGGDAGAVRVDSVQNILTQGDSSNGIAAQSIGGGGGNGGFSFGLAAATTFSASVSVGGFGDTGGDGSAVTVESAGTIVTNGTASNGILAQSIGGSGGNGGLSLAGAFNIGNAGLSASIGGFAAAGGTGGDVTVESNVFRVLTDNVATIETHGESANGIAAQSIGGGGGNGGFSGSFTGTVQSTATVALSVGGFGAAGNKAGSVDVTSVDNILTEGNGSTGIMAQSIGGGGGNGGFSFAGSFSVEQQKGLTLSASLGGFGGSGGDGGLVRVESTGIISTSGAYADGILAQSIGGGGGNGGVSVAAALNACSTCGASAVIGATVGGFGGAGGVGGDVRVIHDGAIFTTGDFSAGVRAQSVGGGGGNGGVAVAGTISGRDGKQIMAAVGGFGGAGSSGGDVSVTNSGAITTGTATMQSVQVAELGEVFQDVLVRTGRASHGIVAQSVGGGGGNGGFAVSGGLGLVGSEVSVNVGVTVGGLGGSGGVGGVVEVVNDGAITTYGNAAHGVFAQSIGGGGGSGGGALTGIIGAGDPTAGASVNSVNVAVTVGGFGGSGNTGGNVSVEQSGGISTSGVGANGIFAQSIGGGGGTGGDANTISLSLGSKCSFDPVGAVSKVVKACDGANNNSANVQVAVGGGGGTGNDAGTVTVHNVDYINTTGFLSAGIVAQSIGGGGGSGGNGIIGTEGLFPNPLPAGPETLLLPLGTEGTLATLTSVTVGGFGGVAGNGNAVSVTNDGAIGTTGLASTGILAQSVGGGGGDGGKSSTGLKGTVAVGGFGGASGDGGAVTVTNTETASIITTGDYSNAILAHSVGGGGGDGGAAAALAAVGGYGGAAGDGGAVTVTNEHVLQTSGLYSAGILAQSVGGGGGNGGGVALTGITIGGGGGASGNGGEVLVFNTDTGTILTMGKLAHAILAQSVGGGGGSGGSNSLIAAVAVGGAGGSAGSGGHVKATNDGAIETQGDFSVGVFAQSIGGGGGTGGSVLLSGISIGGVGGSAGNGGLVEILNTASVKTTGRGADALRAQSVGGGGGAGGGIAENGPAVGLIESVGGNGNAAGDGGKVVVQSAGMLLTDGDLANGIFAQSIGGGGGTGGTSAGAISVGGRGGAGGNGGEVSVVNAVGGTIWTKGVRSNGIYAQSVGGGGGTGGGAESGSAGLFLVTVGGLGSGGGTGGNVSVANSGEIQTDGIDSQAIFAQSVGGGGGNGGIAGNFEILGGTSVVVGGSGGAGGNGGAVTVTNHAGANIFTNGANSTAIFAQSVGGGGGNGGFYNSTQSDDDASFTVGGDGGAAGDGGAVTVVNDGTIVINAKNSIGIMAQSVGGGGGTASAAAGTTSIPVTIGGQNGAQGNGGDVTVTNTGSILINGNNSVGIFAQSVGGGGGMIRPGGGVTSIVEADGGVGDGGVVTVTNDAGMIVVTGDNSIALYSQSIGSGGGSVGLDADPPGQIGAFLFSGAAGGAGVSQATVIDQTGDLIATGFNSIALVAQSNAADGNGDITVNIHNPAPDQMSLIEGGSGQGAGVYILDGATNALNNASYITTVLGIDGFGIRATTGDDTVNNTGVVVGSVDLAGGINDFNNTFGAFFLSGVTANLGPDGLLTNDGVFLPGDWNRILTTDLTGSFVQSADAIYGVDLNLETIMADRVDVSGAAEVSGTVLVNLIDPLTTAAKATPGTHDIVIVATEDGETHPGIELVAPQTVVATYSLQYPNGDDIVLRHVIDYSPEELDTLNRNSVGDAINRIQTDQTSPGFAPVATSLFFLPDADALGFAYDLLSGSGTSGHQILAFQANDLFLKAVDRQIQKWVAGSDGDPRTVARAGESTDRMALGANVAAIAPGTSRFWASGYGGQAETDGDDIVGSFDAEHRGGGFAIGVDYRVSEQALVGAAIGAGGYVFDVPDVMTAGRTQAGHVSVYGALKGNNLYATGTLAFNIYDNRNHRVAAIPASQVQLPVGALSLGGLGEDLDGSFVSRGLSGYFETGYRLDVGALSVTPFAALEFGWLRSTEYSETVAAGSSILGLSYAERTTVSLPTFVGLKLDSQTELENGSRLQMWGSAAWKHEWRTDRSTESAFITAPGYYFVVDGAEPSEDALRVSIGASLTVNHDVSVYGNFEGDFAASGDGYTGTGGIRFSW
jgi:hypothetical protein